MTSSTIKQSTNRRSKIKQAESARLLNKTDLILLQKETEKLGRDAFARIQKTMANEQEETQIILNWCFACIQAMMQTMSMPQAKSLARKVKDYVQSRKNGVEKTTIDEMRGSTHCDLEMIKS